MLWPTSVLIYTCLVHRSIHHDCTTHILSFYTQLTSVHHARHMSQPMGHCSFSCTLTVLQTHQLHFLAHPLHESVSGAPGQLMLPDSGCTLKNVRKNLKKVSALTYIIRCCHEISYQNSKHCMTYKNENFNINVNLISKFEHFNVQRGYGAP